MIGAGKKFVRTDHEVCTAALHLQDTAHAGIFIVCALAHMRSAATARLAGRVAEQPPVNSPTQPG